jgi:hypothetical protein
MSHEVAVVVRVETREPRPTTVSGRIESPFGDHSFVGWLELLGHLEDIVDRARAAEHVDQNQGDR